MMRVYADHAATTQLDPEAFETMKRFLTAEYGNASQPYSFARTAKEALKSARAAIAECVNAEPSEIYFTSCGSESDNWAIKSAALSQGGRRKIITSQIEHHAVMRACRAAAGWGVPVTYLEADREGVVQPSALRRQIGADTKLVSIMYANNEIGSLQRISDLCETAHGSGALFHTDAVQAVGHVPVDVKALDVDLLSASAHKFNGPKGVGFLYVKQGVRLAPFIDGGAQESGMRAGTENVASIAAMAAALKKNCRRMAESAEHLSRLEKILIRGLRLSDLDFIRNGGEDRLPGIISLSFKGAEGEMLLHRLDLMGICVSTGSACDSRNTQLSHVLKAIHVPPEYAAGTIRISLGYENTEEEVRYIADSISKILNA